MAGTFQNAPTQGGAEVKADYTSLPIYVNTYFRNECFRNKINELFKNIKNIKDKEAEHDIADTKIAVTQAIIEIGKNGWDDIKNYYDQCTSASEAKNQSDETNSATNNEVPDQAENLEIVSPFDRRLGRVNEDIDDKGYILVAPYGTKHQKSAVDGYTITKDVINNSGISNENSVEDKVRGDIKKMRKNDFYRGVPSLINTYAITRLYGSKGGQYLIDRPKKRHWYEVDQTKGDDLGFTKNPTTSSIINWGNGDPYSRTPYHFTDFAFCKYWNKVENNRMITLRRFAAPIYDNMKFPGMKGTTVNDDGSGNDGGSSGKTTFPPMATAITYFGGETNNTLNDILNFTTGFNWSEQTSDVHKTEVQGETPGADQGAGGLYGGYTKLSKSLNIAQGNWNQDAVLNNGQLPPDPYENGPYENRIIGPVNRITTVKKRDPGINYENTISLVFEYVARPYGGVNTKAALLDILSNFLVMNSATAMFWGGQHRFMGNPQQYPFLGGDKGIQEWYSGNPVGWGDSTVTSFAHNTGGAGSSIKDFFSSLFNGGDGGIVDNLKNAFSGDNAGSEGLKFAAAKQSSGTVPYLSGLKALLIGEPVGEWHVTIGNPLNPIARIGNLISKSVKVEFGEELGPDDFPTEMKFTVELDHGMPRDRDAIQSIFNRGMGRIYSLPDGFKGSADFETEIDDKTGHRNKTGRNPIYHKVPIADSGTVGGSFDKGATRENAMHGSISVWNREKFAAVSPNEDLDFSRNQKNWTNRSVYKSSKWITRKTLE